MRATSNQVWSPVVNIDGNDTDYDAAETNGRANDDAELLLTGTRASEGWGSVNNKDSDYNRHSKFRFIETDTKKYTDMQMSRSKFSIQILKL